MSHIHEKIDFTVQLWIVHKNKVLLRFHEKFHFWLGVGGHIELDEDPLQAALREAKEEVGLEVQIPGYVPHVAGSDITEFPIPDFFNRHKISATHDHVNFEYFAVAKTDVLVIPDTHEKAVCQWFTREEIEKLSGIRENARKYALAALDALGTKSI